tara:strand:+ start:162 stop:368 length:207 start_codon:yes stop_codon:yes gene_type:complete
MRISWQDLTVDALDGVIEDFVTREGTEYGVHEVSLANKVAAVRGQLERGEAVIVFDLETDSCTIQPAE